jgi:hypothetical protein
MSPELEHELVSKYPDIFKDYKGDPKDTCLAFGIECGDGWFDIIERLCYLIQSEVDYINRMHKDKMKYRCWAFQVKEKYGSLHFYYDFSYAEGLSEQEQDIIHRSTDHIGGMSAMASQMSSRICEHCGARGKKGHESYARTLCDACDTLSHDALSNRDSA